MAETINLIKYVVGELSDRRLNITKTGLVKLLFLSDVESLRRGLPRISSVEWILYKYGPYAFEIEEALRQIAGREVEELAGISSVGRAYKVYSGRLAEEPIDISPEAKGVIQSVLDRWGGESLGAILDYVYFETEPMLEAEWRRPLNFSSVRRREPAISLTDLLAREADPSIAEQLSGLKARFQARAHSKDSAAAVPSPQPRYDETFLLGLRIADASEEES